MFKFLFGKRRKFLDAPVEKREVAHRMLDTLIDQSDSCLSWDIEYNLQKYIKGLKAVYTFKEV